MRETGQQQSSGEREKASLYQEVTDRIIAELEQGRVPWVQPWGRAKAGLSLPKNATTGRRYSGVNILILWGAVIEKGFVSQQWLTFRQALGLAEVAGKSVADANVAEKTKTQKQIIRDCLAGTNGRAKVAGWLPGFMEFPFRLYGDGTCTIAEAADAVAELFPAI